MANSLRTAIIGYGISGRISPDAMRPNPAFNIVAVCDLMKENRDRAASDLNCSVYADYKEMLSNENLDLVSIVTRSDTHASIACDCLEAGLHTVVTKPWALNQEEAKTMLAAEKSSNGKIFPWIPMYWSPDYKCITDLLSKKLIGDIFLIRRYYSDFRYRTDWQTEKCYGGGYLLNWGMHLIQPVISLAQSPTKRVFGQLQQAINPGDADDNFMAVMEFENGIRGVAEFTQSIHPFPGFVIQGARGTIVSNASSVTVNRANPAKPEEVDTEVYQLEGKQFGDESEIYNDIAANLLEGAPYSITSDLALEGTIVLDAVRLSHELRQTVEIS